MYWYHLKDGNLAKCYMVDIAFKEGEMVPTKPLIEAEDWAGLAELGWYREYLEPYSPYRAMRQEPVISPHPDDGAVCAYSANGRKCSIEVLKALKAKEVTSQIPVYSGTDIASNFRIEMTLADMVRWADSKLALIASSEDWENVAGIDTEIRFPLEVSDSWVTKTLIKQVEAIVIHNQLRVNIREGTSFANLRLEGYLKVLYDAEEYAYAPPAPPAEFRQKIYVPNESELDVLIKRIPRGDFVPWRVDVTSEEISPGVWIGEYGVDGKRCGVLKVFEIGPGHWMMNQPKSTMARIHHIDIRVGSENNTVTGLIRVPPEGEPMLIPIYHGGSVSP